MADIVYNPDGTVTVPTGYLSTKEIASMTLEVAILSLNELRKVNEHMATLRERVAELTTAVQGVAERVGASDLPSLTAALNEARSRADELTGLLTAERLADAAEDADFQAQVAEARTALSAAVTEADDAASRIGESVETLNSIAPAPQSPAEPPVVETPEEPTPEVPAEPETPVEPAPEAPADPAVPDVGTDGR